MGAKILSTNLAFSSDYLIKSYDFYSELYKLLDNVKNTVRVAVFLIDVDALKIFEEKVLKGENGFGNGGTFKLICDKSIDNETRNYLEELKSKYPGRFHYKIWNDKTSFHSKFIILDDWGVIVGSHNLKKRSMKDNFEISVLLEDKELIEKLTDIFEYLFKRKTV